VRLEVLTTAIVNVLVLWDVTPCNLVGKHKLFELAFCPIFRPPEGYSAADVRKKKQFIKNSFF